MLLHKVRLDNGTLAKAMNRIVLGGVRGSNVIHGMMLLSYSCSSQLMDESGLSNNHTKNAVNSVNQ